MIRLNFYESILFSGLLALICISCTSSQPDTIKSGKFVDSPVRGMEFFCENINGLTDANGTFHYIEGKEIYFKIGSVTIGDTVPAKELMTPIDLVKKEYFATDDTVVNIARFLQSLDVDYDPNKDPDENHDNGIEITSSIRNAIKGITISFDQTPEDFTNDETVIALFDQLNAQNVFNKPRPLKDAVNATNHLLKTLAENNASKVVLINLGDGFTNGTQSTLVNEFTQIHGFAQILADYLSTASDMFWEDPLENNSLLTWVNPLLEVTTNDEIERNNEELIPYNLGVNGATVKDVLEIKTGTGNNRLDKLLKPIMDADYKNEPVTQIEAAEYLANEYGDNVHHDRLKIFTLWIGINDVLGAVTAGSGSSLDMESITDFLTDTVAGHDLETIKENLDTIVEELAAIPNSHIFIGNIPDVTTFGILFNKTDIVNLATPFIQGIKKDDITTLSDEDFIGYYAFVNPNDLTNGIAYNLNTNIEALNTAIENILETDVYWLSPEEAALINERVDAINGHIQTISNTYSNVTLVNINTLFIELLNGGKEVKNSDSTEAKDTFVKTYGHGFFSLDGVHPSHTGYVMIANKFIEAINGANIGIDIPEIDIESIWESDPYQKDKDEDGFIKWPSDLPDIANATLPVPEDSKKLLPMADCNDAPIKGSAIPPPYVAGTEICE